MKFFKLKFRRVDIFFIPLMCVIIFAWEYYSITKTTAEQNKKVEEQLEKLLQECRNGKQESCNQYSTLLQKATASTQ